MSIGELALLGYHFLKGFDSAKQYVKQVEMFLDYPETNASMHESLNEYFDHMHEQVSILKKDEGKNKPRFASTTMRSIFAMLKKFFLHTGRGNLETEYFIKMGQTSCCLTSNVFYARGFRLGNKHLAAADLSEHGDEMIVRLTLISSSPSIVLPSSLSSSSSSTNFVNCKRDRDAADDACFHELGNIENVSNRQRITQPYPPQHAYHTQYIQLYFQWKYYRQC